MAENSKIEWCDHTFNPWTGCTKVSPACDHCYAEGWAKRSGHVGWGPHGSRRRTSTANWAKPLKWDREAAGTGRRPKVFCASLADVFDNHGSITSGWRGDLWHLIARTPNLDWLLLTKRPQNIKKMLPDGYGAPAWGNGWSNVWLGTTVENQAEADRRIPRLLATPAAVRFVSAEPLLGPVDMTDMCDGFKFIDALRGNWWHDSEPPYIERGKPRLDWVITGGESGPGARPMHPDWARALRDQCQTAGVAFFFKQWGEWFPGEIDDMSDGRGMQAFPDTEHDLDADNWEGRWKFRRMDDQGFLRVGKARAGRLLDGREWNEMPYPTGDTP